MMNQMLAKQLESKPIGCEKWIQLAKHHSFFVMQSRRLALVLVSLSPSFLSSKVGPTDKPSIISCLSFKVMLLFKYLV